MPLSEPQPDGTPVKTLPTRRGCVHDVRRVTPGLLEVTVAGFDDYPLGGGDEFVYVMVSAEPGGIVPDYTMDDHRRHSPGDTVQGAYYTIRRARPAVGEIDLWVVEHDHPGSVAAWMRTAAPGDPVALWGPRRGSRLPHDAQHTLLVADETGFAAVAALLESLPADRRATAVLECVGDDHRPPMPEHPGLATIWVDRGDEAPGVTNRLLERITAVVTATPDAAFGAAESRQISAVRGHLRHVVGIPATRLSMTGYWRRQVA